MRMNCGTHGTSVKAGVLAKPKLQGVAAAALSFIMMLALAGCPAEGDEAGGGGSSDPVINGLYRGEYTLWEGNLSADGKTYYQNDNPVITLTADSILGPNGETILSGLRTGDGAYTEDEKWYNYLYAGTEKIGLCVMYYYPQNKHGVLLGYTAKNQHGFSTAILTDSIVQEYNGENIQGDLVQSPGPAQ